jgi:predicted nucleotidyltransferase
VIPTQSDLDWIVGRITNSLDASAIYLFGSQAKGLAHPGSDIDLLIVGPSRLPPSHRRPAAAAALATFPAHFDLLFYTEDELADECRDPLSFAARNLTTARLLYERPRPPKAASNIISEPGME